MQLNKKTFFEYEFKDDSLLSQKKINMLCETTKREVKGALAHHLNQSLQCLCIIELYDEKSSALENVIKKIMKTIGSLHRKIMKDIEYNSIPILELNFLNFLNTTTENIIELQITKKIINEFLEDIQSDLVVFFDCKAVLRAFSIDCEDKNVINDLRLCNQTIDKIMEIVEKLKNIKEYKRVPYFQGYILDIDV